MITDNLHSFLVLFAAIALFAGCTQPGEAQLPPDGGRVVVNFHGEITRSPTDDNVESLDLIAFRTQDGCLDAAGRTSGGSGISASLSCGIPLTIYILANSAEGVLDGIESLQEFLESETLLEESPPDKPVMFDCFKTEGLSVQDNGKSIAIRLKRYVAKVSIGTVSVNWLEGFDPVPDCSIGRIALVNAKGSTRRSGDNPQYGDVWYNKSDLDAPPEVAGMLIRNAGITVTDAQPVTCNTTLYTMPNHSDSEAYYDGGQWTPRRSRIAIELIIDGIAQWYPVTLPALDGNCHYHISNVSITGPGAVHPDGEILRSFIGFTISLAPWTENNESIDFNNNQI